MAMRPSESWRCCAMPALVDLVHQSVERLDGWLVRNGWAGYDPYDLKGLAIFTKADPSFVKNVLRAVTYCFEPLFPMLLRRVFRIPKQVNAKAMGLFAEGYRQLFEATGDEEYLQRAKQALAWLEANPSEGYAGYCWGYPFDWQSRVFISKGTPSSVVTATAGHAFWGFYQMTGDARYLDICRSICEFFLHDLNQDQIASDKTCFSYTPIDRFHVHNANLFVVAFLFKVGNEVGSQRYIDAARLALNYTLGEQNDDGSICYWGRDQADYCRVDHYHSGFEIRSLHSIWKTAGEQSVYEATRAYYSFYLDNLFENQTMPKMKPESVYPIDIHSCAEAILCNSILASDFPEAWVYLSNTVPWIIKTMQHPAGWFIYMIRQIGSNACWKLRIPYIRWGQAWMLNALATLLIMLVIRRGTD
jgi:hypothetical protein